MRARLDGFAADLLAALNFIGHGLTRLAALRNLSTLDFLLDRDFLLFRVLPGL